MITVGCAGFAVPATRYVKDFDFVEIQETHTTIPGTGTVRRWKREAPPGFQFGLIAPRDIGQEGFRTGKVVETALESVREVKELLSVGTGVFIAPPDFGSGRNNKAAVKEFLAFVRPLYARIIFEPPPGWDPDECDRMAADVDALSARDPLLAGLSKRSVAYYRLHGPAGHKSRYEDPAIEKLSELARKAKHTEATYIFTNVDMFADAKRFKKAVMTPPAPVE